MAGKLTCMLVVFAWGAVLSPLEAFARPLGQFGSACKTCHAGAISNGREVQDMLLDVVSSIQSAIPAGHFGDPDRGEGPLSTYVAEPGGTFDLLLKIKDPKPDEIVPRVWSTELNRVSRTDPDFQAGNLDKLTWLDGQLQLSGAMSDGNGRNVIPNDATDWTEHIDAGFLSVDHHGETYFTSSDTMGHQWTGPLTLSLAVTVPDRVLLGWYDLEAAIAGRDVDSRGFYDHEHFYLNVVPEPTTGVVVLAGFAAIARRRSRCRISHVTFAPGSPGVKLASREQSMS